MSELDVAVFADRVAAVERHLARVAARLPSERKALLPSTDASDAVILHLWQAVQIVIDLAVSLCVRLKLGTPTGYGDTFARLGSAGHLDAALAGRLAKAAGFRNVVAHAYDSLDMARVWDAARVSPSDLRAFLARARDLTR